MRVGFTGSREYPRHELVEAFVASLARKYPDATVISGGRGKVDETAETVADNLGLEVISFRPEKAPGTSSYIVRFWMNELGKPDSLHETPTNAGLYASWTGAAFGRNTMIVKSSQRIVGFWDLESRGTADTLSKARGAGVPRTVYGPEGEAYTEEQIDQHVHRVLG